MSKKRTITPDFLAALSAGAASPDQARELNVDAEGSDKTGLESDSEASVQAAPAQDAPVQAAAVPVQVAEEPAPDTNPQLSLVAHLKAELAEARSQITALSAANGALQTEADALNAAQPGLTSIVKKSIEVMAIALGTTVVGLDTMSTEAVCAYHAQLSAKLVERFPVGGKAKVSATPAEPSAEVEAIHPARRAAVSSSSIK